MAQLDAGLALSDGVGGSTGRTISVPLDSWARLAIVTERVRQVTPRTILDDLFNHAPSLTSEDDCTESIVIPLLIRTGFTPSQIRRKVSITRQGSQGFCKQADIVIYSDGRPMMVVETKRLGHRLTEEDSNQALAYTQLLNPAALFAVLTNGRDWEVYRLDRDEIGGLEDLPDPSCLGNQPRR